MACDSGALPSSEPPDDEADQRRRSATETSDEDADRHELGDEQPGPADRPDEQVAQGARLRLARRRVPGRPPPPRPAGTAAARWPARRSRTATRWPSRPTGTPALPGPRRDPGRRRAAPATIVGSRLSRPIVTQVRRRPNSLRSSTTDQRATSSGRRAAVRSAMTSSSGAALRRRARRTRTPAATRRALRSAGSVPRTTSRSPSRCSTVPSSRRVRRVGVRGLDDGPAGRRPQRREVLLEHEPTAVEQPDPGAQLARPRPAGGSTGRPSCRRRCSSCSSSRISRMPCGSRPLVGSSSTSSSGWRSSAAGQPEPLPHARASRPTPVADPTAPSPTSVERLLAPGAGGRGARRRAARRARGRWRRADGRLAAPDRWP